MEHSPASVSVIGSGSWGTALANLLAHNIPSVKLWGRDSEQLARIAATGRNERYLPGIVLATNVEVVMDLAALPGYGNAFVLAVPSDAFRHTLIDLLSCLEAAGTPLAGTTVIWGSKGFDPDTGGLLGDVVWELFGGEGTHAVISGPSFAAETARSLPTALTLACRDEGSARTLAGWFRTTTTRVYYSDDMTGVQLGGAIKNVMAIAAGISDGLGFGANARAALITRGLHELTRLGVALGGRPDTFMGLTGMGDLVLTCTDDQSRNRRFGMGIGAGKPQQQIRREIGQEIEGINTVKVLHEISRKHNIEMPITEQVYRVLYHDRDPRAAVQELLQRDPRAESGHGYPGAGQG